MYTDPEEARSDLFLVGAVYLFGPLLLGLLDFLLQIRVVGELWVIVRPLVTTALPVLLLTRYRQEPASAYGLGQPFARDGLRVGALIGGAFAVVAVVATFVGGQEFGVLSLLGASLRTGLVAALANLTAWIGLGILAGYATIKARDAFRSEVRSVEEGVTEVGRVLGIVGGIAAVLVIVGFAFTPASLLLPVGAAAGVYLLYRGVPQVATTTRATLITPVVLLALGPLNLFAILTDPRAFIFGVWLASLVAAGGLVIGTLLETRRDAGPVVAFVLVVGLFFPAFL